MTVSSVSIQPIENLTDWYKVTLVSRKNGIGESTIELLCSDETLRQMRREIDQILPPSNHENLAWMKED